MKLKVDASRKDLEVYRGGNGITKIVVTNWKKLSKDDFNYLIFSILNPLIVRTQGKIVLK